MKNYLADHTNVSISELKAMLWQEIVDKVILPKLAGRSNRWHITDDFMCLMGRFGQQCIEEDRKNGTNFAPVLFTVAMQRLSKGALRHEGVNFREQLPDKYWEYSSAHDDYGIMTPGCLEFIYGGLPVAANFAPTRKYALIQLWGLVEHLDADGKRYNFDLACANADEEGKKLYALALRIVEEQTDADEQYRHYATFDQWRKHKAWFRTRLGNDFTWNDFFALTYNATGKGFIKRWKEKKAIKCEIMNA